jgi:DNA-binding transcriptional LysR family regulator
MDNLSWDDLRVLLAVHRGGSLLQAGRQLNLSTSTTGRRIAALEAALGTPLVLRSQVGTTLTAEALRLIQLVEGFAHELQALGREASPVIRSLRISVPTGMAAPLAPALIDVLRDRPHLDIELVGENRMADVAKREADIAVRLVRSTSNVLVEKSMGNFRFALFASADYARLHLPDRRLHRATAADQLFIGLGAQWKHLPHERWMASLGATRYAFRSSAIEAIVEAVRQGMGLAALLEADPRHGDLVRIDTETVGPSQPLYLVYHPDLRRSPDLRAVVTAIESSLRAAAG